MQKLFKLIALITFFLASGSCFAQEDTITIKGAALEKDTLTKRSAGGRSLKRPFSIITKSSLTRPLFGETTAMVETRFKKIGFGLTTGYLYYEFLIDKGLFNRVGVSGYSMEPVTTFYFENGYFGYFSIGTEFKFIRREEVSRSYGYFLYPYQKDVCSDCEVREQVRKFVSSLNLLLGEEWKFGKFMLDFYAGLGFKYKRFDIDIREIKNNAPNVVVLYDDYKIRAHRFSPQILSGIRLGFKMF